MEDCSLIRMARRSWARERADIEIRQQKARGRKMFKAVAFDLEEEDDHRYRERPRRNVGRNLMDPGLILVRTGPPANRCAEDRCDHHPDKMDPCERLMDRRSAHFVPPDKRGWREHGEKRCY